MHGSHIYPEGAYIYMSADVDNILCLCFSCHFYFWHKHPLGATLFFKTKYPALFKTLRLRSQKIVVKDWEREWRKLSTARLDRGTGKSKMRI